MTIDFSSFLSWFTDAHNLWALVITVVPGIIFVHYTKTLFCIIIPLAVLNFWQRKNSLPVFNKLCSGPRKSFTMLYSWLIGIIATWKMWPKGVPVPEGIPMNDWAIVNGMFGPLLVMGIIMFSDKFSFLKPVADFLGSNEYDPEAAAQEISDAQAPLKIRARQMVYGTKKVVQLADGTTEERDASTPSDKSKGEQTVAMSPAERSRFVKQDGEQSPRG